MNAKNEKMKRKNVRKLPYVGTLAIGLTFIACEKRNLPTGKRFQQVTRRPNSLTNDGVIIRSQKLTAEFY